MWVGVLSHRGRGVRISREGAQRSELDADVNQVYLGRDRRLDGLVHVTVGI